MAEYQEQRDKDEVLVGYSQPSKGRFIPIALENRDYQKVQEWISQGNTADADPMLLDHVKDIKRAQYIKEGVRRIALRVPEWDNFKEIGKSALILGEASDLTADQIAAKDIYCYIKNTALPNVDAQGTPALVNAIDVKGDTNLKKEKNVIEEAWWDIRKQRNQLLKDSDYIMFPDITITAEKKEEWETYRQSLRDIPQDYDSPDEVVYPDKPE
jgi:hypothetical protein